MERQGMLEPRPLNLLKGDKIKGKPNGNKDKDKETMVSALETTIYQNVLERVDADPHVIIQQVCQ